jgi:hypothetical protein
VSEQTGAGLQDFELVLLTLDQIEVNRWGFLVRPGRYNWEPGYECTVDDDVIFFRIINTVEITEAASQSDDEGEKADETSHADDEDEGADKNGLVAKIKVAHAVVFSAKRNPEPDEQQALLALARMAVHPLFREKVLTLTADMNIPPLTIPLMHASAMPEAVDVTPETSDPS